MAVTKSTTIYTPQNAGFTLTAYFNENSTSTSNNTSSITVRATLYSTNGAFAVGNAGTLSIYWHDNNSGQDTLQGSLVVEECGDVNPYYFGSKQVEVTFNATHKSDGSLKGYAIAKWENTRYSVYVPTSGTVSTDETTLTNIPREATITTSSEATMGDYLWVTLENVVAGFDYIINLKRNSTTDYVSSYSFGTGGTIGVGFNLSNTYYNLLGASETQATVTLLLGTYNSGTLIGANTTTFVLKSNPNHKPTVSISSVDTGKPVLNNKTTLTLTGNNKRIINGYNVISATWSATTSGYNTNIATTKINNITVTSSPKQLSNVSNSITIVSTDARGYSTSLTESDLTFIAYETPSIVPTIKRNTATDGHANLTFTGMFYNINFGAESNALTLEWYVREKGTQNYTQGSTVLTYTSNSDNKTYVNSAVISLVNPLDQVDGLFDYQKTYEFKFVATDKITSYTISEVILTKGIPNLVVFKNAVLANDKRIDNYYSTSEVKIGTWIDGKPLYRKVLSFTDSVSANTLLTKAHGISDIDIIFIKYCCFYNTYKVSYPLNVVGYGGNLTDKHYVYADTTNIYIYGNGGWGTNWTKVIVLEYTKTTDS